MVAHPRWTWLATGLTVVTLAATACGSGASSNQASAAGTPTAAGSNQPGGGAATPGTPETETNVAGDIPDSQAFVTYAAAGAPYSVEIPEGWARTTTADGVRFAQVYNAITIAVTNSAPRDPTKYAQSTELPAIRSASLGFTGGKVRTVSRNAGRAVLITYRAYSPPNPVTGKVTMEDLERYDFFSGQTEVSLTLASPVGADNVDPWRRITDSFRWR